MPGTAVQSKWVHEPRRIVSYICVLIDSATEANWIFTDEPSAEWVIISGSIVEEASLRIEVSARVLEGVGERAGGRSQLAERVECIGARKRSIGTAKRSNGANPIELVIADCS